MDEPVAAAEKRERGCDDIGLIGGDLRQVTDPRPTHAETEQDNRQDAAGRGRERAKKAADRHHALPAPHVNRMVVLDRHSQSMHPVATTGSRTFPCGPSRFREPKRSPLASFLASPASISRR